MPRSSHRAITVDQEVYRELERRAGDDSLNTRLRRMLRLSVVNPTHRPRRRKPRLDGPSRSAAEIQATIRELVRRLHHAEALVRQKDSDRRALQRVDRGLHAVETALVAVEL